MEERIIIAIEKTDQPQTNDRVDTQTREHALQQMAKDLEAKFVFVMGTATKAKKLPHLSKIRKQKGTDVAELDTIDKSSPDPIDLLDILQAYSYKLENLRNKIRYIEQLETSTSTSNTTKIV